MAMIRIRSHLLLTCIDMEVRKMTAHGLEGRQRYSDTTGCKHQVHPRRPGRNGALRTSEQGGARADNGRERNEGGTRSS
jgi:hypothetical protein